MKLRLRLPKLMGLLVLIFTLLLIVPNSGAAPLPGAIFTTDSSCTQVDGNIYLSKDAVYLNGGPQHHPGAAGLPDGVYFVQVTNPSGSVLLGTSVGSSNPTPVTVSGGVFTACLQLSSIVIKASDGTPGYDDTPNSGGEYKVWISSDSSFTNNSTKTDNFKVRPTPPPGSVITGFKFYDANVNGVFDPGELAIEGWRFTLWSTTVPGFESYTDTTDANGVYIFENLNPGTYGLCEVLPQAAPTWLPTTRTIVFPINVPPDPSTFQFGNVCLGSGGGLTLGFWSNKNGQALINGADLCELNNLNLVNGNGSPFDPVLGCTTPTNTQVSAGKTNFRNWILSATATNMAYMLSAQYAAMTLNVFHGFVDPNALVYAPGAPSANAVGFTTIAALLNDANTTLGTNSNTTSAGPARTLQEAIKNALDHANNNVNFVQPQACDINYAITEPSCIPQ